MADIHDVATTTARVAASTASRRALLRLHILMRQLLEGGSRLATSAAC